MAKTKATATASAEALDTANELLDKVTKELLPKIKQLDEHERKHVKLDDVPVGKTILTQDRDTQVAIVSVVVERLEELDARNRAYSSKLKPGVLTPKQVADWREISDPIWVLTQTLRDLLRRALPLSEAIVIRLLRRPAKEGDGVSNWFHPLAGLASAVENFAHANEIGEPLRKVLATLIKGLYESPYKEHCRKIGDRLQAVLAGSATVNLEPGEAWSDAALADLQTMGGKIAQAWKELLNDCQAGGRVKISERWREKAEALIAGIGLDSLKEHVLRWFPLVDKPRTRPYVRRHNLEPEYDNLIIPAHVEMLRGLVWCCALREDVELARAVARLALSAYRKIPGKGPRLVSLGNACVTALGMMPGLPPIGQLAILKTKVKFANSQKEIEKAFTVSAAREGLARDEIEELAVPSYGLESVGIRRAVFDDYQGELIVDGTAASLHWLKDGKPLKSVPAAVKKTHAEEFKELQASVKDINAMLPAQRERLDTLYLARKTWPLAIWKERYLDHALLGSIVRRLIWSFADMGRTSAGIWHADRLVDANGKPLNVNDTTVVSLWHPIDRAMEDILAWRDWLERREVVQPFKQAHREVYLLTDAERGTRVYSNRFAAHILRQHQFNALCAARGWKNKLRLMVDDSYPPASRPLAAWNLRAEYWIEGAGSEFGQDTNETGTYLYLSTDQVRFYAIDAAQLHAHASGGGYSFVWNREADEPLPLETIPPLVFSEILRDVDLFVGVASVGNDPNWADGGPGGQYRVYWQSYSFGELSATAQTRKALLERLLPRLKIADRCTLADRFLIVRGSLRSYKIHLGSGNILMEPNDQYLCIVPKQTSAGGQRVFLPFEGDGTLSIILSKAFLLADDGKITDATILSQLKK